MTSVLVIRAVAVPGRHDELVRWYRDHHLPEMLTLEGVEAAEQYELTGEAEAALLTVYTLADAIPIDETISSISRRRPGMTPTTAIDSTTVWVADQLQPTAGDLEQRSRSQNQRRPI